MKNAIATTAAPPTLSRAAAPLSTAAPVSRAARALIDAAISDNTRRVYTRAIRAIDAFAVAANRPVDDALLADYIGARHADGDAPVSIGVDIAAVRFVAKITGAPSPVGSLAQRAMRGARRRGAGRGRGQVDGVGWGTVDAAAALAASGGETAGLRDAAILLVASDALLRVSEVAALDVGDIDAGTGTVMVRRGKTDQEARGAALYLRPRTIDAVHAWLARAAITAGPLFRAVHKSGKPAARRICIRTVRDIIKRRCMAAGAAGKVSGHSLRIGGAQELVSAGAAMPEVALAGRWADSKMPLHYAQKAEAQRGAVAKYRPR